MSGWDGHHWCLLPGESIRTAMQAQQRGPDDPQAPYQAAREINSG